MAAAELAPARRALYVGRFQLFHLGHVDVLRHIAAAPDVDEIVIAIGSAQYDHRARSPVAPWAVNPFTFEERREMIERSLRQAALEKPWSVHALPDYHDWDRWYAHIEERLPRFVVLYSSDPKEQAYFAARGKGTRAFPRRFAFHAGSIRELMAQGGPWRDCLPAAAALVLDRIGAEARVREAFEKDRAEASARAGETRPP